MFLVENEKPKEVQRGYGKDKEPSVLNVLVVVTHGGLFVLFLLGLVLDAPFLVVMEVESWLLFCETFGLECLG